MSFSRRPLPILLANALLAATPLARAESENRSQPLAEEAPTPLHARPVDPDAGVTFEPGDGLNVTSADGDFALALGARVQLRETVTLAEHEGERAAEQVFEIRRARVTMVGHAFGADNRYKIELAFSPRDLGMRDGVPQNTPLLSWYLEFRQLRDATLRMGQYKIPYSRQRVISSGDLQLVDRSLANGEFNHDRDIGFDLRSKDLGGLGGYLRYYAGVYMGEGRDFGLGNATPDFSLHYLGRLEVLPLGPFEDYAEADLRRVTSPKLSLGGAYSFHHDAQRLRGVLGDRPSDGGTTDYHSMTADYFFAYRGLNSSAEFHWREGRRDPAGTTVEGLDQQTGSPIEAARNGYGWFVQAGYLFSGVDLEVAARYSGVRPIGMPDPGDLVDTTGFTSLERADAAGGGLGYYFAGHPFKLQADHFAIWRRGDWRKHEQRFRVQLQLSL